MFKRHVTMTMPNCGHFFIPQQTIQMANLRTEFEVPADVYPLRRRLKKLEILNSLPW